MFQQMADGGDASAKSIAAKAVERLVAESADLRSVAVLGSDGEVLAESEPNDWGERAREIWAAAEPVSAEVERLHVATEAGEVFAVRSRSGTAAIAVAQRFALASLMFCDLRAALRSVDGAPAGAPAR